VCIYFSLRHVFKQVGSPKCSYTDDQEEENESRLFLLLVYSCTHTLQSGAFWLFPGSQKKSKLAGFFLGLLWAR